MGDRQQCGDSQRERGMGEVGEGNGCGSMVTEGTWLKVVNTQYNIYRMYCGIINRCGIATKTDVRETVMWEGA